MNVEAEQERQACVRLCEFVAERLRETWPNDEKKMTAANMCTWLAEEIRSGGHRIGPPHRGELEAATAAPPLTPCPHLP